MIITAEQIQAFSAYLLEEEKSAATLKSTFGMSVLFVLS